MNTTDWTEQDVAAWCDEIRIVGGRITNEPTHGATSKNGTRYCRTCGFSDCPGATTGNCPRWPAR